MEPVRPVEEKKDRKISKKVIIIFCIAFFLALLLALGIFVGLKIKDSERGRSGFRESPSDIPACNAENSKYTALPLKEGDFTGITPLGNLNPPPHTFPTDHIYVNTTGPEGGLPGKDRAKPLYAPGNIWITGISASENLTTGISDYGIDYYPCRDIMGKFGHVGTLSDSLKSKLQAGDCSEYTTGGETYRSCNYKMKERVSAGERIGTAGDGQSTMLDIWTTDYRVKPIEFASPKRWRKASFYNVCPVDYFTDDLKSVLMGMFIGPDGSPRTKEPVCGTIDVDIKGTAQGVWFASRETSKEPGPEDTNMALVPDNVETDKQVFSMGTSGESKGFGSGRYYFVPKDEGLIDRDFSEVVPDGQIYCYDTDTAPNEHFSSSEKSAILLTMPDEETIRVGKLGRSTCGTGPWAMTNYIEFFR